MSTSNKESQANIQSFLNAGGTQAQLAGETYGPKMSNAEMTQLLGKYGLNPANVLSSSNINQTITAPTTAPDDLLGIRNDLYNSLGVNTAQNDFTASQKAYMDAQNALDTALTGESGRTVSMSKIVGEQGQTKQVAQGNISNLQNAATLAQNKLNALKTEADAQFQIRESQVQQTQQLMYQYPGAGIKFSDNTESIASKLSDYQQEQKDEVYKKELKTQAMTLGIKTSGSIKDLEKRISKENKSSLATAKANASLTNEKLKMDIENVKSEISNRGKTSGTTSAKSDAAEEKAFYADVAKLRTSMSKGDSDWNYSWNYINSKYKGLEPSAIDNALGFDMRAKSGQ